MNLNVRVRFLLAVLVALISTTAVSAADPIVVGFQDSQVREMTLKELNRRRIGFELAGDSAIRIDRENLDEITEIEIGFIYEVLPPDRSVNYAKELHVKLIERLDAERVPYEIIEYGDLESLPAGAEQAGLTRLWIVWPEKYAEQVAQILEVFEQELLEDDSTVD